MAPDPQALTATGIRFENRSGALVVITEHPRAGDAHLWACMGCRQTAESGVWDEKASLERARQAANTHAWRCRALPPDDGTGYTVFRFDRHAYFIRGTR